MTRLRRWTWATGLGEGCRALVFTGSLGVAQAQATPHAVGEDATRVGGVRVLDSTGSPIARWSIESPMLDGSSSAMCHLSHVPIRTRDAGVDLMEASAVMSVASGTRILTGYTHADYRLRRSAFGLRNNASPAMGGNRARSALMVIDDFGPIERWNVPVIELRVQSRVVPYVTAGSEQLRALVDVCDFLAMPEADVRAALWQPTWPRRLALILLMEARLASPTPHWLAEGSDAPASFFIHASRRYIRRNSAPRLDYVSELTAAFSRCSLRWRDCDDFAFWYAQDPEIMPDPADPSVPWALPMLHPEWYRTEYLFSQAAALERAALKAAPEAAPTPENGPEGSDQPLPVTPPEPGE